MYEKCLKIATEAHKGQKRKNSDKPYIIHPIAVAAQFSDERMKSIAILHDVLEDTNITAQKLLKMGVSEDIVSMVIILTHNKNESYADYILRINACFDASLIKIADLNHNLSDLPKGTLKDKYTLARMFLETRN